MSIRDFIDAIEKSSQFVWSVFLASTIVVFVSWLWPELFDGLPEWVIPTFHIVAITSTVVVIVISARPTLPRFRQAAQYAVRPIRDLRVRRRLLSVGIYEFIYLFQAACNQRRRFEANPDDIYIIQLEDNGLITKILGHNVMYSSQTYFDIPRHVWTEMMAMEEFCCHNVDGMRLHEAVQRGLLNQILNALPPKHPAVIDAKKKAGHSD